MTVKRQAADRHSRPRSRPAGLVVLAAVLLLGPLAGPGRAQHADFVLFEDSDTPDQPAAHKAVHPLTAPYANSDAFVTTDLRPWFIYHDFPTTSPIDGGSAKVVALQARLALTNELQLVAYKDGYADFDTGLIDEEGIKDIAGGLKWKFFEDWEHQLHAAGGVGYEAKTGDSRVLGNDDQWRLWTSVNKGFDRLHLGATGNLFLKAGDEDTFGDSDQVTWHLHGDYRVNEWFSPVVEVNGYHIINEGTAALPFQGVDVANLGGGKGEDVITAGFGSEIRAAEDVAFRAAYETPLTENEDLFGYRWTFSAVWSF
jgi:hypothetical protein